MAMGQLIDGTPLHPMGVILNDIQELATKSAGLMKRSRERLRKQVRRWAGGGRKVGIGQRGKRMGTMMTRQEK